MAILQQALGPAIEAFLMPLAAAAIVLIPFAIFIAIAREVQKRKMQTLIKEFDNA